MRYFANIVDIFHGGRGMEKFRMSKEKVAMNHSAMKSSEKFIMKSLKLNIMLERNISPTDLGVI
jgi:hypothetical protein